MYRSDRRKRGANGQHFQEHSVLHIRLHRYLRKIYLNSHCIAFGPTTHRGDALEEW
jgi:hypothetical protein